jgi:PAS domain S-box-containing protein
MAKGRKLEPSDAVCRPRRKAERLRSKKPTDPAVEELTRLARTPQENPDPVLRVSAEHVLLYSNPAGEELCRGWGCRLGQKVPVAIRAIISAALVEGAVVRRKVAFASHTYGLTVAPSAADGYVNIYARDITDCQRTQEALRQAEQKFRAIFDTTSDGIFLHDLEARKLTLGNKSCLQMLGYTEEEFTKLTVADLHLEVDLPFIYAQIEEFLRGGKPIRHDIRFQRKDGSIFFADLSPDLVRLDGRRYVVVALKDITERKRAEKALQSERDQARQYLRVAGVMMVALDTEGRITLINEKGCEILGYRPEEILGRDWFDVCLPREIRDNVTGVFHRLRGGDIAPVEYAENAVLRKDGQQRLVAFHNTVLRDPSSRIVGVLFSGEDITARRQAEEALAESERKYRSLVENIPDVTWTTDRQGRTLFISPNVMDVYGYSAEEVCTGGDTWLGNVHPDDRPRVEEAFHELFTRKKPYDVEYRIRRKDGTWIWLHDRSVLSYEKEGQRRADGVFSDITERKRMEEELRRHTEHLEELVAARTAELQESEARYRSLYHSIADGIFVVRAEGQIDDVNDSACAQLGYTREELIGLPLSAVSARPDFHLENVFDRLRAAGSLSYETAHLRKDGVIVPVELSATLLEYRGRQAVLGVARDITERKRAEETLRESEERFRKVFEEGPLGMVLTGRDFGIFKANPAFCAMLGYTPEEMNRMTFLDVTHPEHSAANRENVEKLWQGQIPCYRTEKRYVAKNGEIRWGNLSASLIRDREGRPLYALAVVEDITERKRAEEALHETEARFRTAFEEGAVPMALTALDTTLLKVNSSFCRMLGFSESELVGRSYAEITHPDDRAANLLGAQRLACGEVPSFHMEKRYVRKDGAVIWGDMSTASVRDDQGRPLYCVTHVQDITERRRAEEALRQVNERLELQVAQRTEELRHTVDRLQQLTLELSQAEDRERKRIADILHDDVQQTLAAAKFHLSLLSGEPRSAEESREIVGQVKHMLKDAIEKSRRLSHELSPALYQVDLTAILEWLARHMQQKHGLTVRVEARGPLDSPSEPLKAFLYKVAQELLFNVVKHAGVREARIRVRRLGARLYLSVADRGRGFNPQRLEKAPGFGLLGIRERVQLLGGRMKIKSAPGAGSTLLIAIPYEEPSQAAGPAGRGDEQLPSEVPT